ncbi:MAG: nucleotidyltransferase family protein [Patescibacteria group bacterium]|nr:nucleotidyltransferase family protein [Patescibacteria group bacterium]
MEAVILAGGKGTRLQSVIQDLPKPMAPIQGKPFLYFLLKKLKKEKFHNIVLSVGYKHQQIIDYFGEKFEDIPLIYAIEEQSLGTGGAVINCLKWLTEKNFFVINGDSYTELSYGEMLKMHEAKQADITLCLKHLRSYSRYGTVHLNSENRVVKFEEKKPQEQGMISTGVYCIKHQIFKNLSLRETFSLETDLLEKEVNNLRILGFVTDGYFIDIGIPEDYKRATVELPIFAEREL